MPDSFEVARIRDLAGDLSLRLKGFLWLFIALMDVLRGVKSKRETFVDKIENQNANN